MQWIVELRINGRNKAEDKIELKGTSNKSKQNSKKASAFYRFIEEYFHNYPRRLALQKIVLLIIFT